ncbi:hypothetical protein ACIBQ1_61595 [Nonomuraea sp. NPDC050153]|uniref:hypothetical protein n=1 Tax=Nonomuraea sp. NPDC050153 TaxID=3364359 RepID=UPI0037A07D2C
MVAPSPVWEILKQEGLAPAPQWASSTRADFLRSQADAKLACDFIETVTLNGRRQYILAVVEHTTRRVHVLGTTAHPSAGWVIQAIRNLVMELDNAGCRARYVIRDRDARFPALMDDILAGAGVQTVLAGIRMPRMDSIMERWVQSCRRELLDRCLRVFGRHRVRLHPGPDQFLWLAYLAGLPPVRLHDLRHGAALLFGEGFPTSGASALRSPERAQRGLPPGDPSRVRASEGTVHRAPPARGRGGGAAAGQ